MEFKETPVHLASQVEMVVTVQMVWLDYLAYKGNLDRWVILAHPA
jgi:hypothetical protein